MRFTLYTIAAATALVEKSSQTFVDEEYQLSNEVFFPQVAAILATLDDDELNQIENYMSQIFSQDDQENELMFAQLNAEEDEDELAAMAMYLAQLSGEELETIASHIGNLNTPEVNNSYAQIMSDMGYGEMYDHME